jgi:hypothetical protein
MDLDEHLLARARKRAAAEGSTLTSVVERALTSYLAPKPAGRRRFKLELKTERGAYVGGVSVDDRDALYEQMDGRG